MYSSFVMNLVALHAGPTFPRYQPKSFQTDTDRIEHSACHRSLSASTSTAPPTPPRDTQRERVNLARFAILLDCMQTPSDVGPAPAVPPTRLAWRVAVERERERQTHGTQNEQMWFLVAQPFLCFDLVGSLLHPKRRSIATPALNPNTPARRRLVDEYDPASATASAPSASASRLSSGMLSSTIDPGSGAVYLRDLRHLLHDLHILHDVFLTRPGHP